MASSWFIPKDWSAKFRIVLHESNAGNGELVVHHQNRRDGSFYWGHYYASAKTDAGQALAALEDYHKTCAKYGLDPLESAKDETKHCCEDVLPDGIVICKACGWFFFNNKHDACPNCGAQKPQPETIKRSLDYDQDAHDIGEILAAALGLKRSKEHAYRWETSEVYGTKTSAGLARSIAKIFAECGITTL